MCILYIVYYLFLRPVYREDLQVLKQTLTKQAKTKDGGEGGVAGKGISSAHSHGRKTALPESSLTMQFIHG